MSELRRRAVEGGSYRVVVSLVGVTLWLFSLGLFDKKYAKATAGTAKNTLPETRSWYNDNYFIRRQRNRHNFKLGLRNNKWTD